MRWWSGAGQRESGARTVRTVRTIDFDTLLANLLINLFTLAMPLAMLLVFDRVIPNAADDTLRAIFVILVLVLGCDLLVRVIREHIVTANVRRAEADTGRRAVNAFFGAAPAPLNTLGQDGLIDRLQSIPQLRGLWTGTALTDRIDLLFGALFLGIVALMSPRLVIIPLGMIALVALTSVALRGRQRRAMLARGDNERRRSAFLTEVFRSARLVKTLGIESQVLRRYENLQNSASDANDTLVRMADLRLAAQTMAAQITTALTCAAGAALVVRGELGLAELSASLLLCGRAVQPAARQCLGADGAVEAQDAAERLDALIALPPHVSDLRDRAVPPGGLQFDGVAVSRPDLGLTGVRDLSFTQAGGSIVTVSGPLGTGPDLILQLIAGEIAPDSGRIALGLTPPLPAPEATAGTDWQAQAPADVILVMSDAPVFDATLRENLIAFHGYRTERAANALAQSLGLYEHFGFVPGGADCRIGGGTVGIGSAGFFNLIAITRAMALRPRILLLQDPFAGIDPSTHTPLIAELGRLTPETTIVVSNPVPALKARANLHITLSPNGHAALSRPAGRVRASSRRTPRKRLAPPQTALAS